jgi:hypothetical protein
LIIARATSNTRRAIASVVGIGSVAALVLALSGCAALIDSGSTPPLDHPPADSQIEVVGTINGETTRDSVTDFELSDGRLITVDFSTKRRVGRPGGSPAILVVGRDDRGDWAAVIGHQDGTPDGCHVLNDLGYDLGRSIAVGGVSWRKSPRFHAPVQTPRLGQAYDQGARFCLDENAQVVEVIAP